MINKFFDLPLRFKISSIYISVNLIIFVVNIFLILAMNSMSVEMDMAYQGNRHLNELRDSLAGVQDSMTKYLSSKSSDSLENYYRNTQNYSTLADGLEDKVTDLPGSRMERNIKNISLDYLNEVNATVEAKRGRNVEKYRAHYESATELYEYINSYIISLDLQQFVSNSAHYTAISDSFKRFEIISIGVMFAVLLGSLFIITGIIRSLIRPLNELAETADEVAKGNLDTALPEVKYNDEVGIVTKAFNQMVLSIKQYISQLTESMEKERDMQERELMMETHLKDAQLKYLQAQINPHFLFNTLNAGAQLAMMEGANRTYEYVQTVADFFRYNVKKQETNVTIGEEVTLIDNYIEILNVRFSGDIKYEKQTDKRLLNTEMPSMILQPIVENAVNHGIREMMGEGKITLKVFRGDDSILISVKDNGIGMSADEIEKVLNGKKEIDRTDEHHNGIGMDNVIARLKLFAGTEDVIDIKSEGKDKGCEVIISLPVK